MAKIKLNYDENAINDFVSSIQKMLPDYEVNSENVNDFSILIEESEHCKNCKGLNDCKNQMEGLKKSFDGNSFYYEECEYKKEQKILNSKNNLIHTIYLPKKILEADLANFDTNSDSRKKIYKQVLKFISNYKEGNKNKGLYLYGTFSIGKTYALACIANELAKNDIKSLLIYFPDLVIDLKNAMINDRLRYESLINELKSIDVLMLDDLGSENVTSWVRDELIGPILNYRLCEGLPIFISSNISPSELKDHFMLNNTVAEDMYAERIMKRIAGLVNSINMDDSNIYPR